MEQFEGRWNQLKEENQDAYMKACGVSFMLRKVASVASPSVEFRKEADGSWTFLFYSTVKNGSFNFKLGEEADETTPDGRKYKSTVTVENGKLIHRQKPTKSGEHESVIERWVEGDVLHSTATCDGVLAKFQDKKQ